MSMISLTERWLHEVAKRPKPKLGDVAWVPSAQKFESVGDKKHLTTCKQHKA